MTRRERVLTERQITMLFVVGQNEPVSVRDVAYHLLMDEPAARSRLVTLERRGMLDRQYTGHYRESLFAYTLTAAGWAAVSAADIDEECQ